MATPSDNAMTKGSPPAGHRGTTPFWVWLLVLGLGALAVYGGYTAISNYQRYYDTETAREALARHKDRLEANVTDLKHQIEQARKAKGAAETALKQSRADTKTAQAQISDLQGQVSTHQGKITSLQSALAAAEDKTKQAVAAKEALEKEVESLKSRLNDIQAKLDAALADLTQAQKQSQTPAP